MPPYYDSDPKSQRQSRFPSVYTVLFALVFAMVALAWIIPAGEYQPAPNAALAKDVPVPGTYAPVEAAPQGFFDVLLAPIAGFYDPVSYTVNTIDVSLFVLIVGGFLGGVTATGAIKTGVANIMLGAGVGVIGSTINPFSTAISSNAAGMVVAMSHGAECGTSAIAAPLQSTPALQRERSPS